MSKKRIVTFKTLPKGRAQVKVRCYRCGRPQVFVMPFDDAFPEPVPSVMNKLCSDCEDDHQNNPNISGV